MAIVIASTIEIDISTGCSSALKMLHRYSSDKRVLLM